jgi:15,16-dihydrobiliverdin:ferredoxin oxidoreductase
VTPDTSSGPFKATFGSIDVRGRILRPPTTLLAPPQEQKEVHWTVQQAESSHGMPWSSSIDPSHLMEPYFMDFWNYQLSFMKDHLTNLHALPVVSSEDDTQDLSYVEQYMEKAKKRMITLCFASDEYRLIRLTLMDAGTATQVFTSVWYPRGNLPILATDLLQFQQRNHHLTIVDFQPIHTTEAAHDHLYEHLLEPIREASPNLQHEMTDRFYDKKQFFSSQILLGRGSDPAYIWNELFPAYQKYVRIHVDLAKQCQTTTPDVLKQQAAYDDYSAERDPAHGLLSACFGKEYANKFVYDILFPLSTQSSRK